MNNLDVLVSKFLEDVRSLGFEVIEITIVKEENYSDEEKNWER